MTKTKNCELNNKFYVECSCSSPEHSIRFSPDYQEKEIYVEVFLTERKNIFQRLFHGVKYIFGYKSKYGHFTEIIMDLDTIKMLKSELENFVNSIEKNK